MMSLGWFLQAHEEKDSHALDSIKERHRYIVDPDAYFCPDCYKNMLKQYHVLALDVYFAFLTVIHDADPANTFR